ncbi:hypothetical protein [Rhodococcus sp. NPDC055024]
MRYEVDYTERLSFGDIATIELVVASIGRSSARYDFTVTKDDIRVASGSLTAANTATHATGYAPWPDDVRTTLSTAGRVRGERIVAHHSI